MGTTAQKLEYLNTTKGYIKDSINLTGANITTETFRNYAVILKDTLASLLKDPTPIWTNFPKVEATGTSFTISTYDSLFEMKLSGDTVQNGTPAPDNEVPVQTVSGRQVINVNSNAYEINLGKNLYQPYGANNLGVISTIGSDGLVSYSGTPSQQYPAITGVVNQFIPIDTYTFSINETKTYRVILKVTYSDNTQEDKTIAVGNTSVTFTTAKNVIKYYTYIYPVTSGTYFEDSVYLQLEKGNTATSYAPYFTPIELCKIGTYQDYIYKNSGKWYIHKEIEKYRLDSTKSWSYISVDQGIMYRSNNSIMNSNTDRYIVPYCNYFHGISLDNQSNRQNGDIYINASANYIDVIDSTHNTTTLFKSFLNENNVYVYYVLATATNTEITNNDLINQLDSVSLQTGTNVITVSGTLPAILYIKALQN